MIENPIKRWKIDHDNPPALRYFGLDDSGEWLASVERQADDSWDWWTADPGPEIKTLIIGKCSSQHAARACAISAVIRRLERGWVSNAD